MSEWQKQPPKGPLDSPCILYIEFDWCGKLDHYMQYGMFWNDEKSCWQNRPDTGHISKLTICADAVSYWMPVPEPPKEKEREAKGKK